MAQVLDFESHGGRTSTGLEASPGGVGLLWFCLIGEVVPDFAPTMGTRNRDPYHETFYLSQDFCSSPPTAIPF
jgi:hypothetical protein